MIVFDLKCGRSHVFEAWFGSSGDFEAQRSRGLISCPLCEDSAVEKAVMAPAVGAKGNRHQGPAESNALAETARLAALRAAVEKTCDDVGDRFAVEARARHRRSAAICPSPGPARGLVGEATIAEALDLLDEGIPVAPLPFRLRRASDA
jgi:hypothetical protein